MSRDAVAPEALAPIGDVSVTLVAELDRTSLPFLEVADWRPGSIVRLPNSAGETISIRVGDVRLVTGEVLVIDGVLAVRVSDLAGVPNVAAPPEA
jgi:flagellar motor switch/type III secretory pathway protein FliN